MKLNPAYFAVLDLQDKFSSVKFDKNSDEVPYCMIHLVPEKTVLMMAGKNYQSESIPHFSIYKLYQENENNGFSVFHYTWYGFVEENNKRSAVVLHVYFDRIGRYLYCQLKNRNSRELIENISKTEEKAIEKLAKASSQTQMNTILQHITESYARENKSVNDYLSQLDLLSKHIETQLPKYKRTAKLCMDAMEQKNKWTFNLVEQRAELLSQIVAIVEENVKNQQAQLPNKCGFYSAPKNQKNQQAQQSSTKNNQKQKPRNAKLAYEPLTPELKSRLAIVESKMATQKSDAEGSIAVLDLLNEKFRLLMQARTTPFLENELVKVLQEINAQHKTIQLLFEEKAKEGDIEAVKLLRPFISITSIYFFHALLILENLKNIAICKFMIQNFDECLWYLNKIVIASDESPSESISLMGYICLQHTNPDLLEMLLQNGANPNFLGGTYNGHQSLLKICIAEKKEDFVRVLLENGADPNPKPNTSRGLITTDGDFATFSADKKSLNKLEKKPMKPLRADNNWPLIDAIITRNETIIAHLLQYGASINQELENLDALGWETCCTQLEPNLATIKLLITKGAAINAVKLVDGKQTTALISACKRNNLPLVEEYINLGADPNQEVPKNSLLTTALNEAALKNNLTIVHFLMTQKIQPLSYATAALTVGYFIRKADLFISETTLAIQFITTAAIASIIELMPNYKDETIAAALKTINDQGERFYKEKNYETGPCLFLRALIFWRKEKSPLLTL